MISYFLKFLKSPYMSSYNGLLLFVNSDSSKYLRVQELLVFKVFRAVGI